MILDMFRKSTRYLDLSGDPVGYPKPVKLALRSEFMMAALCIAGCAQVYGRESFNKTTLPIALGLFLATTLRKSNGQHFNRMFNGKVIDKEPDEAALVGSFKYRHSSDFIYKNQRFFSLLHGTIASGAFAAGAAISEGPLFSACLFTCTASYHIETAYNFRKLAKGEWAFVEEPPKETVLEHLESSKDLKKLQPAPQI